MSTSPGTTTTVPTLAVDTDLTLSFFNTYLGGNLNSLIQGLVQWFSLPALTYSSTDGHTFVVTVGTDLTSFIGPGARIKLTDSGTKYFIVTAITSTTITLYGGQNYALTGGAITNPFFSFFKAPVGFPLDPTGWTETFKDTTFRTVGSPVTNTWYNVGTSLLAVPIGAWDLEYSASPLSSGSSVAAGAVTLNCQATLSTANNSESDSDFTAGFVTQWNAAAGSATVTASGTPARHKKVVCAVKTTYYLNLRVSNAVNTTVVELDLRNADEGPTIIRAVCAYL